MRGNTRSKRENLNGNFGAPRVQGKRDSLDLTKEILMKDDLRIPNRDEAFTRLVDAYNKTTDSRLKAGLWEMLKQRKATLHSQPNTKPNEDTTDNFWEMVRTVR